MSKYIITGGVFHPVLTPEEITNARETGQTLSQFGIFEDIKKLIEKRKEPLVELDTDEFPDINHGTIFQFDEKTGRYFTTFVFTDQNPDGKPFNELYREYLAKKNK